MKRGQSGNSKHTKEKYLEDIAHHLTTILRTKFGNPMLKWVSITKVELNRDHSEAKVYWDTFDNSKRGDLKKSLEDVENLARKHLASCLNVRHTPRLLFLYDAQYEEEKKIEEILNKENNF